MSLNRIAELISRAGTEFGERTALVEDTRSLSFATVEAASNRLASALSRSLELHKGDRVALLLPNCLEFVVADFALLKAGLIRVPVNPRCAIREIQYILQHSGAAAVITSSAHAASIGTMRHSLPDLKWVISVDRARDAENILRWDEVLETGSEDAFATQTMDVDGYMIAYTSGTTGRPKGALTTLKARWVSLFNTYANEVFVSGSDVMLHVASLAHGSGTKVLPFYAKGAKNVLMKRFTPAGALQIIEREKVTTTWVVPTMVAMLLDAIEECHADISSLKTIIYGGAPMPSALLERALNTFGPIFVQIYGLTEAPHPDLILAKEDHLRVHQNNKSIANSVTGRVAVGARVRLLDDSGAEVPIGQAGELVVSGDHIMCGYWNDPEATAETIRDGWCHSGDIAKADAQGFYYIIDRKKELIISGGYNVYPREVEDVIYRCPGVRECAVIGSPDPVWGETVHAFIVASAGAEVDYATIRGHCAVELADYKKPRRVTFLSELPKTANGKIDKKALRAMCASEI